MTSTKQKGVLELEKFLDCMKNIQNSGEMDSISLREIGLLTFKLLGEKEHTAMCVMFNRIFFGRDGDPSNLINITKIKDKAGLLAVLDILSASDSISISIDNWVKEMLVLLSKILPLSREQRISKIKERFFHIGGYKREEFNKNFSNPNILPNMVDLLSVESTGKVIFALFLLNIIEERNREK